MRFADRGVKALNWDDLKLVKAVAEAGGRPSLAAAQLGVNPSTIFRRLKELEEALGVLLFERHRDGYVQTEAGSELCGLAERIGLDVTAVTATLAARVTSPRGELTVTTNDSILTHLIMPTVSTFKARYPDVCLNLLVDNSSLNLARRDADVALRATEAPPENLLGRRICRIAWALYGHARDEGTSAERGVEWAGFRQWVALGGGLARLKVTRDVEANVSPGRISVRVNSVQALAEALESGVGVGFLPCFVGDQRSTLKRLSPVVPELSADLWLLSHPGMRRAPRVRAFVDFIVPELLRRRALLEGCDAG